MKNLTPAAFQAVQMSAGSIARAHGQGWKVRLALHYKGPRWPGHTDRIAQMLTDLRAAGIDVGRAVRLYERQSAELGLDVDVPVEP